jgi:hypothetical protein
MSRTTSTALHTMLLRLRTALHYNVSFASSVLTHLLRRAGGWSRVRVHTAATAHNHTALTSPAAGTSPSAGPSVTPSSTFTRTSCAGFKSR